MDEGSFVHCYNSIKFEENKDDPFSAAAAQRKRLALNFFASIKMHQENDLTNNLLENDLKTYSEIVDDQRTGKVNNYSEAILALLPPNQYDNRAWKSNLDEFNVKDFVKPLPCTTSNDFKCHNAHLDESCLNHLQNILNEKAEPVESNRVKKLQREATLPTRRITDSKQPEAKPNETLNPNFESKVKCNADSVQDDLPEPDNSKWKGNMFKTAREELHLQNLKKYGNSHSSNESTSSTAPVKKSLGTRKAGGVFGKFQPPTRPKDKAMYGEVQKPSKVEEEEEIDERLKNIDPRMVELIKNEIMDCGSTITWDDIAGLELAKNTIQEIVVWPMLRPDIFTGLRRPPKGILLFGPPGTGKTLIGKCIASQSSSTFFSISASSLTSKWIGDGEKMVRALFAVARCHQPAVVFIDEIDSLLSQRSDSEHESSRRLKTEFLVQLDGAGTAEEDRILIIGATNRPQELDEAARRRLVKRLYIPLPDEKAREQIIRNLISRERHDLTEAEINEISVLCKGYSGADMKNVCQEAALGPIRSIRSIEIKRINAEEVRPLNVGDFRSALNRIKSSVSEGDLDIYIKWDKQYGCGSGGY